MCNGDDIIVNSEEKKVTDMNEEEFDKYTDKILIERLGTDFNDFDERAEQYFDKEMKAENYIPNPNKDQKLKARVYEYYSDGKPNCENCSEDKLPFLRLKPVNRKEFLDNLDLWANKKMNRMYELTSTKTRYQYTTFPDTNTAFSGKIITKITKSPVLSNEQKSNVKEKLKSEIELVHKLLDIRKHSRVRPVPFHLELYRSELPEGVKILCKNCSWLEYLDRLKEKHSNSPASVKNRKNMLKLKIEVLGKYSNGKPECVCCGFRDIRVLEIDHIRPKMNRKYELTSSGSPYERKLSGYNLHSYIKKNNFPIDRYQVLCRKCNNSKADRSDCYHQSCN